MQSDMHWIEKKKQRMKMVELVGVARIVRKD